MTTPRWQNRKVEATPIAKRILSIFLFAIGAAIWIFDPRLEAYKTVFRFGPGQLLIPALGIIGLLVMFNRRPRLRLNHIQLEAKGFATASAIIIVMCFLHIFAGQPLVPSILFSSRYLLILLAIVGVLAIYEQRVSPTFFIYGLLTGALFSVFSIEGAKRGLPFPVAELTAGRDSGYFSHPNQLGIVASSTLPYFLFFLFRPSSRIQIPVALFGLSLVFVSLYQSLSKTNIALAIGFGLILTILYSAISIRHVLAGLGFSLALVFAMVVFYDSMLSVIYKVAPKQALLIEYTIADPMQTETMQSRFETWEEATDLFNSNLLTGLGPFSANHALVNAPHAHNFLLEFSITFGISGLLSGIIFLGSSTLAATRMTKEIIYSRDVPVRFDFATAAAFSCLNYCVANLLSDSFQIATLMVFAMSAGFYSIFSSIHSRSRDFRSTISVLRGSL